MPGSSWLYLNGESLLTLARLPGFRIRPVWVYGQCSVSATQAQSGRCDARHGPGHRLRWTRFHRWLSWLTLLHFMFGMAMEWTWVFCAELRFFFAGLVSRCRVLNSLPRAWSMANARCGTCNPTAERRRLLQHTRSGERGQGPHPFICARRNKHLRPEPPRTSVPSAQHRLCPTGSALLMALDINMVRLSSDISKEARKLSRGPCLHHAR